MIRGTTPRLVFEFKHTVDFIKDLRITFEQNGEKKVEKKKDDVSFEDNKVIVKLLQEDTLAFSKAEVVEVQLKVLTVTGDVLATDVYKLMVQDILNEEILE